MHVEGAACLGVFIGDVIKQKVKVNEYRQKRVCSYDVCKLNTKHRKSIETTAGVYASNSPAPYKHIISATWGREDVTDLAQELYYEGFKSFYPLKDIWQTNWDNWK